MTRPRPPPPRPIALAEKLLADPVAAANDLPALVAAASAVPTDEPSAAATASAVGACMLAFQAAAAAGDLAGSLSSVPDNGGEADEVGNAGAGEGDGGEQPSEDPTALYRSWLAARFVAYRRALLTHCARSGAWPTLQVAAVRGLLEAGRGRPAPGGWDAPFVVAGLEALLCGGRGSRPGGPACRGPCGEAVGEVLARASACVDVRHAAWQAVARAAAGLGGARGTGAGSPDTGRTLTDLLTRLPPPSAGWEGGGDAAPQSWCGALELGLVSGGGGRAGAKKRGRPGGAAPPPPTTSPPRWATLPGHRAAARRAWVALLSAPLPPDAWAAALEALPAVIPDLDAVEPLADALAASARRGGRSGLAALAALFDLITRRRLEYDGVYAALYACLTPDTAVAAPGPVRARAWALADAFLASPAVPAYTAAAFAKRAARLALASPPGPAGVALATIHNILRRHPACCVLLHAPRRSRGPAEGGAAGGGRPPPPPPPASSLDADPYDDGASDPAHANALASSLWEVAHLARHWSPGVAAAAAGLLAADLTDRTKSAEADWRPGLGTTYASLVDGDLGRRMRKAPSVAVSLPEGGLFGGGGWAAWEA